MRVVLPRFYWIRSSHHKMRPEMCSCFLRKAARTANPVQTTAFIGVKKGFSVDNVDGETHYVV
jgi:hypothetical protein